MGALYSIGMVLLTVAIGRCTRFVELAPAGCWQCHACWVLHTRVPVVGHCSLSRAPTKAIKSDPGCQTTRAVAHLETVICKPPACQQKTGVCALCPHSSDEDPVVCAHQFQQGGKEAKPTSQVHVSCSHLCHCLLHFLQYLCSDTLLAIIKAHTVCRRGPTTELLLRSGGSPRQPTASPLVEAA